MPRCNPGGIRFGHENSLRFYLGPVRSIWGHQIFIKLDKIATEVNLRINEDKMKIMTQTKKITANVDKLIHFDVQHVKNRMNLA